MAILPGVPGLSVTIVVDGRDLEEYEDEGDQPTADDSEVVKYVQSAAGSTFSIYLNGPNVQLPPNMSLAVDYFVDGKHVEARIMSIAYLRSGWHCVGSIHGAGARWMLSKFKFADIVTSEEAVATLDAMAVKNLGTISVAFTYVIVGDLIPSPHSRQKVITPAALVGAIPETKLKGLESLQQVSYEAPEPTRPSQKVALQYPYGRDPFARIVFKYRSRASLQSKLLIPRTPSPPPVDDNLAQMSREELLETVRKLQQKGAMLQMNASVRREHPAEDHDSSFSNDEDNGECIMLPPKKKVAQVFDLTQD